VRSKDGGKTFARVMSLADLTFFTGSRAGARARAAAPRRGT
jgi:hypothetical protein